MSLMRAAVQAALNDHPGFATKGRQAALKESIAKRAVGILKTELRNERGTGAERLGHGAGSGATERDH